MTVQTLNTGRFVSNLATATEIKAKVQEVKALVDKYGFGNRKVAPYGTWISIDTFLGGDQFTHYSKYTTSSKRITIAEMNGFIKILNEWIKVEEEPKVLVRFLEGKHKGEVKEIPESYVVDYIDVGLVEVIRE